MSKNTNALNQQQRIEELKNQNIYFDLETNRLEQKCRVKDAFPVVNNLIRLNIRKSVIQQTYFKDEKENFHTLFIKDLRAMKMEFSISIDGLGRQEFIKLFKSKLEEEEEIEKKGDVLQQIADAIG